MTRKQLIIDSALQLFAEKGIEATSVQQITELSGISKGAFYLSFKSKEELIFSIIEQFLNNIIREVDQVVNNTTNTSEKLHVYFVKTFTTLSDYTGFAEILMKEKVSSISAELIERIQYYVKLSNENLVKLLFDVFGDQLEGKQYDLVMVINGMVQAYLQLILEAKQPFDLSKLADSLVEKTTILATQSKIIFLQQPATCHMYSESLTIEKIILELHKRLSDTTNDIEKDSVLLLIEELHLEKPRTAMILGLVANIEKNDKLSWISLFLKKQFSH